MVVNISGTGYLGLIRQVVHSELVLQVGGQQHVLLRQPVLRHHAVDQGAMQCCGSGSKLDPFSGTLRIRIRIRNTDPDPHR